MRCQMSQSPLRLMARGASALRDLTFYWAGGSNCEAETRHSLGDVIQPLLSQCKLMQKKKVFLGPGASRDDVITQFGH